MKCPNCAHPESRVVDSRTTGDSIRRRRQCAECQTRFSTQERVEQRLPWVTKKDGRREPWIRSKVTDGIVLACRKRPVDAAAIEAAVLNVEGQVEGQPEVTTERVGAAVMDVLRRVDPVAYVRFASVYQRFESVEQFMEALRPLQEEE